MFDVAFVDINLLVNPHMAASASAQQSEAQVDPGCRSSEKRETDRKTSSLHKPFRAVDP
ncbi:hypothetical protein PAXRUDRAFT_9655 [Paxillus rubicundulus Ve08.2h10]|uniref:Uncharacterized protein n=1 Tax=Paxillus rubicundulus Ve08.2h10 TaxID=930991 RepID=A0A0D0E2M1_9AGAM|nr:hypothetical protein PAXRUDRAFT_9655 [Paxillus rubicundulus Ve08.2h10]